MKRPTFTQLALVVAIVLSMAIPAIAQSDDEDDLAGIDTIIVTITKRDESLLEVAATISAFNQDTIKQANLESLSDVVNLIPNMQVKGDGNAGVSIRGISQSFSSQAPVAQHINGVFQREAVVSYQGLFYDLQGIEVQRGPVGTVYGRNATAGAINVRWAEPIPEYEVFGDATVGNYSRYQFRGGANIPFFGEGDERLMGRFVFQRETRDNYSELLNRPADHGGEDRWSARGTLKSVITEDLTLTLRGSWSKDREASASQSRPIRLANGQFAEGIFNLGALGTHPFDPLNGYQKFLTSFATTPGLSAILSGAAAGANMVSLLEGAAIVLRQGAPALMIPPIAPRLDTTLPLTGTLQQASNSSSLGASTGFDPEDESAAFDGDLDWMVRDLPLLGDVRIHALGGWTRFRQTQTPEADGTQLVILDTQQDYRRKQWVGEVNLSSENDGPFTWLVGYFYFTTERKSQNTTVTPFSPVGMVALSDSFEKESGFAPFANVTLRPFEIGGGDPLLDLELFGGIRYNKDVATVDITSAPFPTATADATFRELTYELGFRIFPVEDHTLYLKYSKGYKPGILEPVTDRGNVSMNPRVFVNSVDEEVVRAWEAGWKANWMDGRLQTQLTGFYYTYANLQVPKITGGVVQTENAAAATNKGVEIEVLYRPTEAWTLQVTGGWLDATYDEFCSNDELDFTAGSAACIENTLPGGGGFLDLSGNHLEDAPEFKAALLTSYEFDLGEWGTVTPVAKFTWTDDYYRRSFNRNDTDLVESYTRTDLRLIWTSVDQRYDVELFVENLENERVYARTIAVEIPTSLTAFGLLPPRVFGVRVGFHFGGQ